ncbi:hypothetical protein H4R20_001994 [Coemansia guatemalensis]|uniref:Eukaryotic translation initiation factor 3 subunit D n=1 Tax=Coemansia guatemalensis TaxID=2761395 RepID=A0A9W8LSQ7_9FUNG|nr:hypothetical protein H4R20_001994 [Coemansia guatemalensis]
MSELPSFSLPRVFDNPKGWGPTPQSPAALGDIPYDLYSKGDKVNRVANWINPNDSRDHRDGGRGRGRRDHVQQTYGSSSASAFAYQAEEDEESFSLVGDRGVMGTNRKIGVRAVPTGGRGGRGGGVGGRGGRGRGMQRLGGGRGGGPGGRGGGFRRRFGWRDFDRGHHRFASVKPTDDWELVQEIEFNRMSGLSFLAQEARSLGTYGTVGVYDHLYDRVNTKLERPLKAASGVRLNVTASQDPVLNNLASTDSSVKVFATDTVIATLMASMVSTGAWDVVANRVGDRLFFDKRDGGPLDFPSVNENAAEPPAESSEKEAGINSASMLAGEARDVNRSYISQITAKGSVQLEHPNPFNQDNADTVDHAAYRYRILDLSAKAGEDEDESQQQAGDRCLMAIRTEISGYIPSGKTNKQLFLRALTQHDINAQGAGGALDWRQKLDSQRGAVIATEMKNNASKLARWAFQAVLADADQLRIGFVARATPRDRSRHAVLGFQSYNPSDFVQQLSLSEFTAWGIVKALVDLCLGLDEGKYVIMRDPNKPLILIYSVPLNSFEDDAEEDEEEEDLEKHEGGRNATAAD